MNERIKELAEESGMTQYVAANNKYLERFAELLIKKCAEKANAIALDIKFDSELDARKYVGDSILKSFGVE